MTQPHGDGRGTGRWKLSRVASGLLACVVGGVWIAQGTGHLGGSFMTGDPTWTLIGIVTVGVGLALLSWARSARTGRRRPRS